MREEKALRVMRTSDRFATAAGEAHGPSVLWRPHTRKVVLMV